MPPLLWQLPQVLGTLSGYTAERASVLGNIVVRVAVAACAGMLLAVGVDTVLELSSLIGVAGLALDGRNLVRMRIALDVGMAVVALKAAVNAVAEFLAVDSDAVSRGVGHAGIAVASQTVRLRTKGAGRKRQNGQAGRYHSASDEK